MQNITKEERTAIRCFLAVVIFYGLVSALAGCAPYVEYQHLSDPRIANDGYDLACVGLSHDKSGLSVSGGVCSNLAPYGGEFLTINARYTLTNR